ncbi:MAG: glycosyl hydrolase [Verrucomicrobiales bacterium]|nr:glycosyl hydrolase [Verrucomicrobiales bacterium]
MKPCSRVTGVVKLAGTRMPGRAHVQARRALARARRGPVRALVCSGFAVCGFETPVKAGASARTQSLLAYLWCVFGGKILSGPYESQSERNALGDELRYIEDITGGLPAILSMDLADCLGRGHGRGQPDFEYLTQCTANWYLLSNRIVVLHWHWCAPLGKCTFYTEDTHFDIARAVLQGTRGHPPILRDVDEAVRLIKMLRNAGVPVSWRPLHESNRRWFWWWAKGPQPLNKLWWLRCDRFTDLPRHNNLLWAFPPAAAIDLAAGYPVDAYVGMIGMDHYPRDGGRDPAKDFFDELVSMCGGTKLVGVSETRPIPEVEELIEQWAHWLCFVTWSGHVLMRHNTTELSREAYVHPRALVLGQFPDLARFPCPCAGRYVQLGFAVPIKYLLGGGSVCIHPVAAAQVAQGLTVRYGMFDVMLARVTGPVQWRRGRVRCRTVNGVTEFPDAAIAHPRARHVFTARAKGLGHGATGLILGGLASRPLREWRRLTGTINLANSLEPTTPLDGREILRAAPEVQFDPETNNATRMSGYLIPPMTGQYVFWLGSFANAELWLGTNGSDESRQLVADVTASTSYAKWPYINEAGSAPVPLEAGKPHYIELLDERKRGLTHSSVQRRMPDGTGERPIPARRLCPLKNKTRVQ